MDTPRSETFNLNVNGILLEWKPDEGICTFGGLPVAMMWIDSTLSALMASVQAMVGTPRFLLALQSEGRKGISADWEVISQFPDFRRGFEAIAVVAAVAGWGEWKLIEFDKEARYCRFRVFNSWESRFQGSLGVAWGCGMVAGKFAGYCTRLFDTNCWAEQTASVVRGDGWDEFEVRPSPRQLETEIEALLQTGDASRADMSVALKRLEAEIAERRKVTARLTEREWFLRQTQRIARVGGWKANPHTDYLEWTEGVFEIVEASKEYQPGLKEGLKYYHDEYIDLIGNSVARCLETGEPFRVECRARTTSGRDFWAEVRGLVPVLEGGQAYVLGTFQDIDEQKRNEEALRKSGERYHSFISQSHEAIYCTEFDEPLDISLPVEEQVDAFYRNGYMGECNQAMAAMYGIASPDEFVGRRLADFHDPKDAAKNRASVQRFIESGYRVANIETYETMASGETRVFLSNDTGIVEDGRLLRVWGSAIDITERKRAEEALQLQHELAVSLVATADLEEGLQACLNTALRLSRFDSGAVYVAEPDRSFSLQALSGLSVDFASGLPASSCGLALFAEPRRHLHRGVDFLFNTPPFRGEGLKALLVLPVLRDNRVVASVLLASHVASTVDEAGLGFLDSIATQASGFVLRAQLHDALRESEEQHRTLVMSIPDIVMRLDRDGRLLYVSEGVENIFDRTAEVSIGSTHRELGFSESLCAFLEEAIREVFASGASFEQEHAFQSERGEFVLNWRLIPEFARSGGFPSVLAICRDVSAHRFAEQEKAKLENQLLQAQKMESVGRLAGGVAHDFNNMLGVILGHVEFALESIDNTHPLHRELEEIRKAATRSANLTRQLLAFARKQPVTPKVLDLNELISATLKMLQRMIGEDIHLQWRPTPLLWPVKMDPSQVDQILANLCVNARDSIADTGRIVIELSNISTEGLLDGYQEAAPGDYVRLALADNGSGMDQETLGRIFEPFFTTKEMGKGTGLGLSTVFGAVTQNNGYVTVQSRVGHGTTIVIYLPRYLGDIDATAPESQTDPALRGGETLLIVEDEPNVLQIAAKLLTRFGYNVLTADSPQRAIEMVLAQPPGQIQLLITDVIMPGMNGRDLFAQLALHDPGLKCVFMSGYTADVIAHKDVMGTGSHFLQKPFTKRDLGTIVRAALD